MIQTVAIFLLAMVCFYRAFTCGRTSREGELKLMLSPMFWGLIGIGMLVAAFVSFIISLVL